MSGSSQRAAAQMTRDGISRIPNHRYDPCCAITADVGGITFRCNKRAGYRTPNGNRCFTHARPQPSKDNSNG